MKILEHRRHSIRDPGNSYLNQNGVDLARKVGETMSEFDYVITSTNDRAIQTGIAMGFAINETDINFSGMGDYEELEEEFKKWDYSFSELNSFLNRVKNLKKYAENQKLYLLNKLKTIKENGSMLIISHGGVVDFPLISMFPSENFKEWDQSFGYCEGYRVYVENDKFIKYELIRVNNRS